MKKKEIKISNEEMMELMGLKRTSNSDDDSDKTAIDLAIEKYSKEELAAKETEQPDEPTTDEDTPSDSEESTKVVEIKEIRLGLSIDTHDFETKGNQARKFLAAGNKVKVSIRFRVYMYESKQF